MKKPSGIALILLCVFVILSIPLFSDDMRSASSFFNDVASQYTGIIDYAADISINVEGTLSRGTLIYKRPNKLRIDFVVPEKQVIVSNGDVLQVYIPRYDVTLQQKLDPQNAGGTDLATQEGLTLLRKNFGIAYKIGPGTSALDDGSNEQVYKLLLTWRNTNQGFRQIELDISQGMFIRRIEGITADRKKVRIDYSNIRINQGIPTNKFDYSAPASSNQYQGFLFGTTN